MSNVSKKYAVYVFTLTVLLFGLSGMWMMFGALRPQTIDNEKFMEALAIIMFTTICWIPLHKKIAKVR